MHAPKIEDAVKMYDENTEIGTAEIMKLFGCGRCTAANKKKIAKQAMAREGKRCFLPQNVNVEVAFAVWGIDIELFKRKYNEMQKYKRE